MYKFIILAVTTLFLAACGNVSLDIDIEEDAHKNSELTSETSMLTLIPEGCMTWFDGCNECIVEDQKIVGCTKKACAVQAEPECRVLVETNADVPWETLEVTVGPERVDCVGVVQMKCLVVNGENFYDEIADFEFEAGFNYRLKIEKYQQYTPETAPADASLFSYQLVEVLEKRKQR